MPDLPDPVPDPAAPAPSPAELRGLRLLRVLVTILTAVMIVGIVTLVVLMARGLGQMSPPPAATSAALPALPDTLEMPQGASAQAVTAGPGWWAVVTEAGEILLFDADGALLRRIQAGELGGD